MSVVVDNKELSRQAEIIFSNGSAYHVELPMAGREEESSLMHDLLAGGQGPRLATLSAPLGSGKTFFLNKVFGQFSNSNPSFDEGQNKQVVLATDLVLPETADNDVDPDDMDALPENPSDMYRTVSDWDERFGEQIQGPMILVIEEIDRKASSAQVLWATRLGKAWLSKGGDRTLLLTGDAVIRHPRVQETLEGLDPRIDIQLEPLDDGLLVDALSSRIEDKILGRKEKSSTGAEESHTLARQAAEAILADVFVRWATVPRTSGDTLANFREALGALRQLSRNVRTDRQDVEFPRDLLSSLNSDSRGMGVGLKVEQALLRTASDCIESGVAIKPLMLVDLAELVGEDPNERFRRRGVEALCSSGAIVPLGIPFLDRDSRGRSIAYTEPYVPSYRVIHRALAGLIS